MVLLYAWIDTERAGLEQIVHLGHQIRIKTSKEAAMNRLGKLVILLLLGLMVTGAAFACEPATNSHSLPGHGHDQPCHVSQVSILPGEFGVDPVSSSSVAVTVSATIAGPHLEPARSRERLLGQQAAVSGQPADQSILCTFRI